MAEPLNLSPARTLPRHARTAMAVTADEHATDAAVAVLARGGNAVDAAVAAGFALAVTHPGMCGIGGGGHVLLRMADGRSVFFDFREQAPACSSRGMFLQPGGRLSEESAVGWRAAAVPGTVAGFARAHQQSGTLAWAELLDPAIRLARDGHAVSWLRAQWLRESAVLGRDPESRRIFQKGGACYGYGELLLQPELARTLERIAAQGAREFYEGETASVLAGEMARHAGNITLEDLRRYRVSEWAPLAGRYKGVELLTAAGSSSGGLALLQMLGILEDSGYEQSGAGSAAAIHLMAEAMRRSFADRSRYAADPDFTAVPEAALLDPEYLARLRASINPNRATPSAQVRPGEFAGCESATTTHYGIVDSVGNAVAVTFTLNSQYGSGVTVPRLGILLNNNMDNFAANPGGANQYGLVQGEANAIQPGKRPVSSITPVIAVRAGRPWMVLGTPGGPTIPTAVLQAFTNVVDFGMDAQDAIAAPRFHHQWYPDRLIVEAGFSPDTLQLLRARGHEIEFRASKNDMNMILLQDGWIQGAVDPRREGKAAGL